MARTRIVAALVSLGLLVPLSACAGRPAVAAEVGNQTITSGELEQTVQAAEQDFRGMDQVTVLSVMIAGRASEQIARQRGMTTLTSEAEALLDSGRLRIPQSALSNPDTRALVLDEVESSLLRQRIGQQEMAKAIGEMPVEVNPRFGIWNMESMQLSNGSLSHLSGGPA